jgi:hypothetical protein
LCALVERKVGWRPGTRLGAVPPCARLESSSTVLQTAAIQSQLPAQVVSMRARKNPMSLVTPGFDDPKKNRSSVTNANAARAAYSPVDWRNYLRLFVRI